MGYAYAALLTKRKMLFIWGNNKDNNNEMEASVFDINNFLFENLNI